MNLLFLVLLLGVGVYLLTSKKSRVKAGSSNMQSALARLNERFVNGEIDEDTYKKMKEPIN